MVERFKRVATGRRRRVYKSVLSRHGLGQPVVSSSSLTASFLRREPSKCTYVPRIGDRVATQNDKILESGGYLTVDESRSIQDSSSTYFFEISEHHRAAQKDFLWTAYRRLRLHSERQDSRDQWYCDGRRVQKHPGQLL